MLTAQGHEIYSLNHRNCVGEIGSTASEIVERSDNFEHNFCDFEIFQDLRKICLTSYLNDIEKFFRVVLGRPRNCSK